MSLESPLLMPVMFKDNKIIVLDETLIPFKEEYIEVISLEEAIEVLGQMKTRSLGQVLLFFYSCVLFSHKYSIDDLAIKFKETRPTFDFMQLAQMAKYQSRDKPLDKAVTEFVYGFDYMRKKRALKLAKLLPDRANILTICNVNGELIYLANSLKALGKQMSFYVCETRPYLQGTRLTLWELSKNDIPCKVICDNQVADLMQKGMVNCVVTGADRATTKNDIMNKLGTYAIARLAKNFDIPFYPLVQYPKDIDVDDIKIEERDPMESFMYLETPENIDAIYPSFDVTKEEFITKAIDLLS